MKLTEIKPCTVHADNPERPQRRSKIQIQLRTDTTHVNAHSFQGRNASLVCCVTLIHSCSLARLKSFALFLKLLQLESRQNSAFETKLIRLIALPFPVLSCCYQCLSVVFAVSVGFRVREYFILGTVKCLRCYQSSVHC